MAEDPQKAADKALLECRVCTHIAHKLAMSNNVDPAPLLAREATLDDHVSVQDWLSADTRFDDYNAQRPAVHIMDFEGGGRLYLGGVEAAEEACRTNRLRIERLIDFRGDTRKVRHHRKRTLNVPNHIHYENVVINRLFVSDSRGKLKFAHEVPDTLLRALSDL